MAFLDFIRRIPFFKGKEKHMEKKRVLNSIVVILLIASTLISCTPTLSGPSGLRQEDVAALSARVIESEYDSVRSAMIQGGEYTEEDFLSYGEISGESVVRGALDSGNEDVLNFLYSAYEGEDASVILETARPLLSESAYKELEERVKEMEEKVGEWGEERSRSLAPAQKEEFYKDLRSMVVKTVVLLTAAVVYAMMPKTMFWGKVSAATAVSVAAGVVTSSLITLIEWSDEDLKYSEKDFNSWLSDISVEPFADWALAQGVLNTQMAATNNPVTSAIVLGVFALYHIGDDAKTLLKKYNWAV